jgi:hypothetical protein
MTQEFYALREDRSSRFALDFLNRYLPNREPCADEYPIPECAVEPSVVCKTEDEILIFLEHHKEEPYGLYWNDSDPSSYAQAMIFYTRDGCAIFGLATDANSPSEQLRELSGFVGTQHAMLGSEQRPPETSKEFVALCSSLPSAGGIGRNRDVLGK